jgi:hypothetical protein
MLTICFLFEIEYEDGSLTVVTFTYPTSIWETYTENTKNKILDYFVKNQSQHNKIKKFKIS